MSRRLLAVLLPIAVTAAVLVATALAEPPTLDQPAQGDIVAEATGPGGATVSWDPVTATDPEQGQLVLVCDPASGSLFPISTIPTPVTCSATDDEGNPIPHSFNVTVEDTTGPEFSDVPAPMTVTVGDIVTYTDPTATDLVDGDRPVDCVPASGFTATVTVTVNCSASDTSGNSNNAPFLVTVNEPPNTPPTLILPGDITREATGPTTPVTFAVSATDPEDNPDPAPTCNPTSGFAFPVGTTAVNCSVTDSDGDSDSGSFDVTIQDTTDPVVTAPANVVVPATDASGAVVSYGAATATDLVDGSLPAGCAPASGTLFPLGTTTVNCTATDDAGNIGAASFTVTVQDEGAPVVDVPANVTVEATGPAGATVDYGTVTATDDVDGPITNVTCSKASGTVFPIGGTTVNCSATDSEGNTGSATFFVTVEDTTPPVLTPAGDIAIKSTNPIPATDAVIQAFLGGATASDLVDAAPEISNDAPDTFELGFTTVTFTATDGYGNAATASAKVEVGPNPSPPDAVDRVAPGNIKKLAALAGNRSYLFRWSNPKAKDFAYVEVTRSPGKNGDEDTSVYQGAKTAFRDSGLADGQQYRYLFVSYDKSGNRSVGVAVVVLGKTQLLVRPYNGATVARPPKLTWKKVPGATLHNLQLYFIGSSTSAARSVAAHTFKKVLSAFPKSTSYQLRTSWAYAGHRYQLAKGCYAWYVWPYLSSGKYGKLLGESEFCYQPKAKKPAKQR